MADLWFNDSVSINVNLFLTVTGAGGPEIVDTIEGVLRKHAVDGDVYLSDTGDRVVGETPFPLIITGFGQWSEAFEADLTAAVAAVAPAAEVELAWDFPDEP